MQGAGRRGVTCGVMGALLLGAWSTVAAAAPPDRAAPPDHAAPPEHAGPQEVQELDLVDDPLSLVCGDRTLVFTGGTLIERVRMLSEDEGRGTRRPVNATLEDQFGAEYTLHGVAVFSFINGEGRFQVTAAVKGPDGTDTVNSRVTFASDGSMDVDERGTCTVQES